MGSCIIVNVGSIPSSKWGYGMSQDDTKVALLVSWGEKGFDWPVFGMVVPSDFGAFATATMTFGDGRSVEVTRDDVPIADGVAWQDAFPHCR
jgi:hypothetical protein